MEKIYLHFGLTFVFSIFCFATVVHSQSMLDKIEKACPTTQRLVHDSGYFDDCGNEKDPGETIQNVKTARLPICMSIYAVMNKICLHNSKQAGKKEMEYKVPGNLSEFEAEVNKLKPKNEKEYFDKTNLTKICQNILSLLKELNSTGSESKTVVQYINLAADAFTDKCSDHCYSESKVIKSKCVILLWAYDLFNNKKPTQLVSHEPAQPMSHELAKDKQSQKVPTAENTPTKKTKPENNTASKPIQNEKITPKTVNKPVDNLSPPKHGDPAAEKSNPVVIKKEESKSVVEPIPEKSKVEIPHDNKDDQPIPVVAGPQENAAENPNNILPEEEIVPDNGFPVDEEHSNKKENDNDDDGFNNERDNVDNEPKESNNLDDKLIQKNQDQPHSLPQDMQKSWGYSSSLEKEEEQSHFFTYLSVISFICIGLFFVYHNKQKILAIALEGRRGSRRGRGSRRRPSTANYRKLDCNLEEAVTSQCSSNAAHVIY